MKKKKLKKKLLETQTKLAVALQELEALVEATRTFAIVAPAYEMREKTDGDIPISIGHFFTTGGSFGPEFSAQVKTTLSEWQDLARAYVRAQHTLKAYLPDPELVLDLESTDTRTLIYREDKESN